MPNINFLSSKHYTNAATTNYGDCVLIDINGKLVIYDCGSIEHANEVIKYMKTNNYEKAILILSHQDADHFIGVPHLIKNNKISHLYTLLLLKHKDKLLELIGDNRKTRESVTKNITEIYNNIYSLSNNKNVILCDTLTSINTLITPHVKILGPDINYTLEAVAKALDSREGDTINNETIINAVSTQVSVTFNNTKVLLCGDSCFDAIEEVIKDHNHIQLPHHGKEQQALKIWATNYGKNDIIYYVSDNTGSTVGGSDKIYKKPGYKMKNTRDGQILCSLLLSSSASIAGNLGGDE